MGPVEHSAVEPVEGDLHTFRCKICQKILKKVIIVVIVVVVVVVASS